MNEIFADTSFFVSFLNAADERHEVASEYMREFDNRIVTSDLVLVELGNDLWTSALMNVFSLRGVICEPISGLKLLPAARR